MKNIVLIALVLVSSACSSVAEATYRPGIPSVGPVLPRAPNPWIRHVSNSVCMRQHNELCIHNVQLHHTQTDDVYDYACALRGTPEVGVGMVEVPVTLKPGHPPRKLFCEEIGFATEMGFASVKRHDTVSIVYVLFDEESGQYVPDDTCNYTMGSDRDAQAVNCHH